jgi:hypothetical protein
MRWPRLIVKRAASCVGLMTFALNVPPVHAQQAVPIRELQTTNAAASSRFGSILNVREIANGRVLVNDGRRRQLLVLDARLATQSVVLDSLSDGGQYYGAYAAPLIPYRGDSTLFPDATARTLVLIDQDGKFARVVSPPKTRDLSFYLVRWQAGSDPGGNLLYKSEYGRENVVGSIVEWIPERSDSSPIVRASFDKRTVEPVASLKVQPFNGYTYSRDANGNIIVDASGRRVPVITVKPLYTIDEWSVLSDGSVAIVRGHDYHVDIIRPDGTRLSAPKLPFDFRYLTAEDKQKLVDSARTAESNRRTEITKTARVRTVGGSGGRGGGGGSAPTEGPVLPHYEFQPASEMGDYYPPIRADATKPDADGNLWILPTTSAQSRAGELVYDVVSNTGTMIERVRLPLGRSIAGFGKGGVVYLMSRNADDSWSLERTRVVRP